MVLLEADAGTHEQSEPGGWTFKSKHHHSIEGEHIHQLGAQILPYPGGLKRNWGKKKIKRDRKGFNEIIALSMTNKNTICLASEKFQQET